MDLSEVEGALPNVWRIQSFKINSGSESIRLINP